MVIYSNEQDKFEVGGELTEMIEACVNGALDAHNITDDTEISVVFTDNEGIRKLNKEMRNIDKETDVLSFPQYEYETPGVVEKDDGYPLLVLGDIVISLEKAQQQAEEFSHSFFREAGYLCVHSMLHLLGYDHMTDADKPVMRKKEEEILEKIGLTR